MKSIIVAGLLLGSAHGAIAAPYINVESNAGFAESNYVGVSTDFHVGVEGDNWYVQGGPSVISPDNGDSDVELSGKVGGSVALSDRLSGYGEVSGITGDVISYGVKVGAKFTF